MNKINKITAVIICVIMTVMSVCITSFGADSTTADAIRFGSDGKLKIMHVTDTHLSAENLEDGVWLIGKACDREKPDIVIITGDIAMADTVEETFRKTDKLMNVFESRNIPVAVTFGNHDSESGVISREALMAHYNTFNCSISVDDGDELPGCGTYSIPVLGHGDGKVKFNIWMFDSGAYDGEGHYANVLEEQAEWYVKKSEALEAENGGKIYSLAFQHIIVPEVYDALRQAKIKGAYTYSHIYDKDKYYQFDPKVENRGMLHEYPCPGYYNHGQFEAMAARGDVLAMFTGHDHSNAFSVRYKNIDIVNSLSTRYNGDVDSAKYGYRMIVIDENNTDTYSTSVGRWYDFFSFEDVAEMIKSGDGNAMLAEKVRVCGFIEKTLIDIAVFFVQMFTGRTVRYPD